MKSGRDYTGVSAGVVLVNDSGQYFLARRGLAARDDQERWEFPGGSVEPFEPRQEAAKRHIASKYGMVIEIERVLNVYDVIDRAQGDHWLSTTYLGRWVEGEPHNLIPDRCDDIGWFSLEKMQGLELSRVTKLNLADILDLTRAGGH